MKAVKDSAQNVAKAIRRNERALKAPTTVSKKRTSPTEATQIEPTITPAPKVPRTKDKTSPGGEGAPNPKTPAGKPFTITKTQFDQKKIHDKFGALYRDKKTGNWVTKDIGGTKGHGGCRFKEWDNKPI